MEIIKKGNKSGNALGEQLIGDNLLVPYVTLLRKGKRRKLHLFLLNIES